ncbi:unnamed protein product [Mytilus edulis]|uniref:DNA-directed DNA polymerase n=1 Tax=Mytilus edulis TaxID=6550 RepID=A0A8S3QZ32_MYTED|nr:unnamed protein product [Mytilus edulis]
MTFLKSKYDDVKDVIKRKIKERGGLKWYLSMKVKMSRRKEDAIETAEPHFRGKCQTSLKLEDIDAGLKESIKKMYTSFIEYQRQGSNWTVDKVVDLTIHMASKKSHFCWIKDLNRLLGDQHSHRARHFHCPYCLHGFTKEKLLNGHLPNCQTHGPQKIELPTGDNKWLQYKDIRKQLKVPYIIYADFECLQKPILDNNENDSKTKKTTKHIPCGFAYKVVGLTPETSNEPVVYRGADAADKFVECMVQEQDNIEQKFKHCEPMTMTGSDWQSFKKATLCHICKKELADIRVRDHCHVTGKFRGAAHNDCNINYKFTGRIPVVFHNLRGYDSHLIIQAIGKVEGKQLNCIANNMEKYISFSLGCMDFIDSLQFMSSSLQKLVENLAKEGSSKFKHMTSHFGEEQIKLLLRKQVYPYEYFDSEAKFLETQLPPIEDFYSTLSGEGITTLDYAHAQHVWQLFNMQNLGQYHDLYVLSDVLALADVFENFREICINYYGLDAAHFYTSPGLAWKAALKITSVKLELLTDIDMHLFIEKGLRGGVSMISHRHAKANNKHVRNYDPNQPITHEMYLDANNLYGWAMSQALPVEGFRWLNDSEIENLNISDVEDDSKNGFILEVDLEYPRELHDDHNEYPLAPEKIKVTNDMLSPYAEKLLDDLNLKGTSTEKLIPNLHPKEKYVVHYRNFKLYLSLGMRLTKIHRVMTFEQRPCLKTYIDFNTEKRKLAHNEFEKDFFKLMNNAVFGKTMENLRKRTDIKLLNDQSKARKLISKPTFHVIPIYVGFTILDLSKTLMYDFHYNYMKDKYGSRATLLFTDTDSLCYNINTDDIYQDMMEDKHLFDTSEYNPEHRLYSTLNKKVLGKMKDETHGIPIQEFVGLKSKMYSLIYEENKKLCEKKTAKGIKKSVIKHDTRHEHYKQSLFNKEIHMSTMTQIRSYDHTLYNISINKLGLSPYDDKRYLLDDGIQSLAYGHWRI